MLRLRGTTVSSRAQRAGFASEQGRKSQTRPRTSSLAKFYTHVTSTSLLTASSCHIQGSYPMCFRMEKAWEHG